MGLGGYEVIRLKRHLGLLGCLLLGLWGYGKGYGAMRLTEVSDFTRTG